MQRSWIWLQLILGWLPVWALITVLMTAVHGGSMAASASRALWLVVSAAVLGLLVHRATAALPWPQPFRVRFLLWHLLGAALFSPALVLLNSALESLLRGRLALNLGPGWAPFLITGVWMYVMVVGVAYAQRAAQRAAQLQAQQARSQLAALRAQIHPHFLFNALHTVVQLIPLDPRGAVNATEQLAGLLRASLEQQSDLVPLAEEWALVQRYLAIEAIRFGERLQVQAGIDAETLHAMVPSFALQTLVENAVRHAATAAVHTTHIHIRARREGTQLLIEVTDNGAGAAPDAIAHSTGTGLRRLRERLSWLHGGSAALTFKRGVPTGLSARLSVPWRTLTEDA